VLLGCTSKKEKSLSTGHGRHRQIACAPGRDRTVFRVKVELYSYIEKSPEERANDTKWKASLQVLRGGS
jgi:hypothetical protein